MDELLSSHWELQSCARYQIPIPMNNSGIMTSPCICTDLENWPNNELPMPYLTIDNQQSLHQIAERTQSKADQLEQIRSRLAMMQQHA